MTINQYLINNKDTSYKKLLIKDNYIDYLNRTKEFYGNYNYESLFD